jgi:hypothetical protein
MAVWQRSLWVVALGVLTACSSGGTGGSGGSGGTGTGGKGGSAGKGGSGGTSYTPAPYNQVTWDIRSVETSSSANPAGIQGVLLQDASGTIFYAYYRYAGEGAVCDIAAYGGGKAPTPLYDLKVAVHAPGAANNVWTNETVSLTSLPAPGQVVTTYGLSGLVSQNGQVVLVTAAGAKGLATCGSSDLVIARRTGANAYTVTSPVTGSSACCAYCDKSVSSAACTDGTDVGAWAAVAESASGQLFTAFTDYHNYWDQDGQNHQGFEAWDENGTVSGIRTWSGLGKFAAAAWISTDPVVAATSYKGKGLHFFRRTGTAGAEADWLATDLRANASIGERISLAVATDGKLGIAFLEEYDRFNNESYDLLYCESIDAGATWTPCDNIDTQILRLGYYPSLKFASDGRPVIAYGFCGTNGCDNSNDGVRLAWREDNGTWKAKDIHNNNLTKSALYVSLVLVPPNDAPVVAFQDRGASAASAMIAFGTLP